MNASDDRPDAPGRDPAASEADGKRLDRLFSATYEELRRLASSVKRSDPGATLSPTTLVNEAWLKLRTSPELGGLDPVHFKRVAARAMRQVLVEAARRKKAAKRGGGSAIRVTLDEESAAAPVTEEAILRLDAALDDLARLNPRQAVMVESRFFGGLDVAETAALLGVSEATVLRDWRAARAWLGRAVRGEPR